MNTLPTIYKFYQEMKSTTKRNEKIAILERWKDCSEVVDLLQIIYDPMITFGVTSESIYNYTGTPVTRCGLGLLCLFTDLSSRKLSGNEALSACRDLCNRALLSYGDELYPLLEAIFDKDLKLGIDTKTVNKVIPGLIDTFDVALAFDIQKSPTYLKRVESEQYLITRKLDGVRCLAVVKNNDIKFYSRLGHEYTSLSVLRNAMQTILPKDWEGVLDGELCVIDDDDNENFKLAVSEVKRKTEQMQRPHYKVFDCLTLDEFYGRKESANYSVRLETAKKLLERQETPFLSVLSAVKYSASNFMRAQSIVAQKGYEGLILRSDTPYRSGRTSDLLKVKKFMDAEYQIEDFKGTTKLMKGLSGTMEPVECLGSVVIRHKGNPVDVGSGFSDAQRVEIWSNQEKYLGKTITVKYFEESADAFGNPSLRFPIFKGFRDGNE
jgi:DNA ligase-1